MKKRICVISCLLLFGCGVIYSQENVQKDQLVVYGKAELKVPADQASFDFSVIGYGSSLRIAVDNARNKMTAITNKLLGFGLKETDISTSKFYSGENNGGKAFLSSNKDYKAYISGHVAVDSLTIVEDIILTLSEMDLETISSIKYDLKDYENYKYSARTQAIENAKTKALQMAEQLSLKPDYVQYVEEQENNIYPVITDLAYPNPFNSTTRYSKEVSTGGSGFMPQTLNVISSVKIIYSIKNNAK